jgi:hypothetical protein
MNSLKKNLDETAELLSSLSNDAKLQYGIIYVMISDLYKHFEGFNQWISGKTRRYLVSC